MSADNLKLQIVVNDEILDLRQANIQKHAIRTRPVSRCASQQIIDGSANNLEENPGTRLKKLANQLSNINYSKTNNTFLRNKIKSRATSADPRFRRVRSPTRVITDKKLLFSRSELNAKEIQKNAKTICSQSVPTLETQSTCSKKEDNVVNQKKCNFLEQSLMTEGPINGTISSNFETATANTKETKEISPTIPTDVNATTAEITVDDCPLTTEKNSEWSDIPRVSTKYSRLTRPPTTTPAKSTWTLPFCCKLHSTCYLNEGAAAATNNTYKFDACTDDDMSDYAKAAKYRKMEKFVKDFFFTPFFILGSILGLCLVASIVWIFANDFFWKMLNNPPPKEVKVSQIQKVLTYVAGAVIYGLNTTFNKVCSILSIQRNEFAKNENYWASLFK